MNTVDTAYDQGFIDKCAEAGVDPEVSDKQAALGSVVGMLGRGAARAGRFAGEHLNPGRQIVDRIGATGLGRRAAGSMTRFGNKIDSGIDRLQEGTLGRMYDAGIGNKPGGRFESMVNWSPSQGNTSGWGMDRNFAAEGPINRALAALGIGGAGVATGARALSQSGSDSDAFAKNSAYDQGFIDKCAEAGVDPEALAKQAGLGTLVRTLPNAIKRFGQGFGSGVLRPGIGRFNQKLPGADMVDDLTGAMGNTYAGAAGTAGALAGQATLPTALLQSLRGLLSKNTEPYYKRSDDDRGTLAGTLAGGILGGAGASKGHQAAKPAFGWGLGALGQSIRDGQAGLSDWYERGADPVAAKRMLASKRMVYKAIQGMAGGRGRIGAAVAGTIGGAALGKHMFRKE